MEKVRFVSSGASIVGDLHLPGSGVSPAPAVVLLGPMTFAKEQAPTEYARRLAEAGYAALAFDPRYRGESGGDPRCLESPIGKVEDVRAAVTFLCSHGAIDPSRLFLLGICQGSSEILRAAADDDRILALATVAGHYRDEKGDLEWLTATGRAERLERGDAAKQRFEHDGFVEYVPAVDPARTDVGMPGEFVWNWYRGWADEGMWENRYAVMSDAELLRFESLSAARRLTKPYLMVHSDNCFIPAAARRHFDAVPAAEKHLSWEAQTAHFQYYDDPVVIGRAVGQIVAWYDSYVHSASAV